jgi:hypothetical protein
MASPVKEIAWNGIELSVPFHWETIVTGRSGLLFEDDFTPLLELRWEKTGKISKKEIEKRGARFWGKDAADRVPSNILFGMPGPPANFTFARGYRNSSGAPVGGICYCKKSSTLLVYQNLTRQKKLLDTMDDPLRSLQCQQDGPCAWRVRDFSFQCEANLTLKDFTLKSGLSRLAFNGPGYTLQTCILSPADRRLEQQSLADILTTLSGAEYLDIHEDINGCTGYRRPSIARQVRYRLKRQQPFISAKIWQNQGANRLLALVLSSKSVISENTLRQHSENYEILQQKN